MSRMTFRLHPGQAAPVQQTSVSCGGACLVMARMLDDPAYAATLTSGDSTVQAQRFATEERAMMRLANAWTVRGGSVLSDLPWTRRLGTSPWGAAEVLSRGTGIDYGVRLLRGRSRRTVDELLRRAAGPSTPALFYVGDQLLTRHVTLLTGLDDETLVYEPARGHVLRLGAGSLDAGSLSLGGWTTAWLLVAPTAHFS